MNQSNIGALLSIREVQRVTSLSRASIYRFVAAGRFPRPVKLSPNGRVAWNIHQLEAWIAAPLDWNEQDFAEQDAYYVAN